MDPLATAKTAGEGKEKGRKIKTKNEILLRTGIRDRGPWRVLARMIAGMARMGF
jgi:hypothetical protein